MPTKIQDEVDEQAAYHEFVEWLNRWGLGSHKAMVILHSCEEHDTIVYANGQGKGMSLDEKVHLLEAAHATVHDPDSSGGFYEGGN